MTTHPRLAVLFSAAILGSLCESASAQQTNERVLRIGATGTITGKAEGAKEKAGLEILQRYIKEETGLKSEIVGQENWKIVAEKMAKGQFQLGVFQGYEFAWAQQKDAELKALAVALPPINVI